MSKTAFSKSAGSGHLNWWAFGGEIFRYLQPYWLTSTLLILCLLVELAYSVTLPFGVKFLVDNAIVPKDGQLLLYILGALALGFLAACLAGLSRDYLSARIATGLINDLRYQIFDKLQFLSADFYQKSRTLQVLSRYDDAGLMESLITKVLPNGLLALAQIVLNVALSFLLNWRLGLVMLVVLPFCFIGPSFFSRRTAYAVRERKRLETPLEQMVQDQAQAYEVIKAYNLQAPNNQKFAGQLGLVRQKTLRAIFTGRLVGRLSLIMLALVQLVIVSIGALLAYNEVITVGSFFGFFTLLINASAAAVVLTQLIPDLVNNAIDLAKIDELLKTPAGVKDSPEALELTDLKQGIRFVRVSFSYSQDKFHLENIDFELPIGQSLALVGQSGAGKSTLIYLLLRFYDPTKGLILVDGHDLREIRQESLRNQFGVVFENTVLIQASIRDNIRLGQPQASQDQVEAAARLAEIHEFVMSLPNGYDTQPTLEGLQLSSGQLQRIGLARAILRDPKVLILNEATSNLDAATEAAVFANIQRHFQQRSVILVTHRLSLIPSHYGIGVLDKGRLVEKGTHDSLVAAGRLYSQLWQKQVGFIISQNGRQATVTVERLQAIPLFQNLNPALLNLIAQSFVSEYFNEKAFIFSQGDVGHKFYIIVRGRIEVVRKNFNDQYVQLSVLEDGDFFGERAILENVVRTAGTRTLTPCLLLSLYKDQFFSILQNAPEVLEVIQEAVKTRQL